jgi:hypothetical protein
MGVMAALITKLLPILHVQDPHAERDFYLRLGLGLRTTYEGAEYPDFLAVGNDVVEFGLSRRADTDPARAGLTWQLGVSDIEAVIEACGQADIPFEVTTEHPRPDWSYRIVTVRAPSGMEVLFEEQSPSG